MKLSKNNTPGTVLCLVWVCLGAVVVCATNSTHRREQQQQVLECFTNRRDLLTAIKFVVQNQHPDTHIARRYGYPMDVWCLDGVDSLEEAFFSVWGVESFQADLSQWNVSSVTSMNRAFFGCSALNFDVTTWDTSRVTDMKQMFQGASAFTGQGLDKWNVSKVTNLKRMFNGATSLNVNLCAWGNHLSPTLAAAATTRAAPAAAPVHVMGMFQGASRCPSQDNPNIDLDPVGPFCHWCVADQQQQQPEGVFTSMLRDQDQKGAARINGQYSLTSAAAVPYRSSSWTIIIIMTTISTILGAMTTLVFW
jgi:surface protein